MKGTPTTPRRLTNTLLCGAICLGVLPSAPAQDDEFEPKAFHLYDTQAARARAEEAADHIAASRWSEGLAELQALIEEHRGEVLGASRPQAEGARLPSKAEVHAGAGIWAVRELHRLPDEGKELYRERFGPRAQSAFERAKELADRGGLARVAQRWPLTEAAERAWWALGDLEVELGHPGDGRRAWARAAAQHIGDPLRATSTEADWDALVDDVSTLVAEGRAQSGALARVEFARESLRRGDDVQGIASTDEAGFVLGPADGVAAQSLTSRLPRRPRPGDIGGWQEPFSLSSGPFRDAPGASRLFPQRHGDTLFVNTSRSLHAIDVFDGAERWRLPSEALGWSRLTTRELTEFKKAIDTSERIVTVAASRGVVVAPLQIPWSFEDHDQYNDLPIIEIIPERRLFALDAETGDVLWNTLPPEDWTGDAGSFAERMTVVGPPRIVGARVLVPMAQLRGRIELHLGCFDLATGDVLWNAPLVTGQRTLNMFGRSNVEFSAPPPVVAGDTVVMLTQLGIVAAVDLFTGETRWNTLYEQVQIRPPQYYHAGWIDNRWRNAPPIVHGNTVVAAPFDGRSLVALDVETGAELWSQPQERLHLLSDGRSGRRRRAGGLDLLLAVDNERVLLGGSKIASLPFNRGLRGGPPTGLRNWEWPEESILPSRCGVPVVDQDRVYVPDGKGVTCLDRKTGLVVEDIGSTLGRGQLLVSRGMLFSTDGAAVEARFEWRAMVERAREAAKAKDAAPAEVSTYARLLLERAESLIASGTDVEQALELTQTARQSIAMHLRPSAGGDGARPRLVRDMHRTHVLRAHAMRLRGDSRAAREAVEDALDLDAGPDPQLEALLLLHEIERRRDPEARVAVLERIRQEHADARFEVEAELQPTEWLAEDQLERVIEVARQHAARRNSAARIQDPWQDPWTTSLVPTRVRLGGSDEDEIDRRVPGTSGRGRMMVSGGLFALLSEVDAARRLPGLDASNAAELAALHLVLRDAPQEPLFRGKSAGLWAEARVHAIRALHPRSPALVAFERSAQALYERGVAQADSTGTTTILETVPELFPGSEASRLAAVTRIEYALENGSPEEVVEIVLGALPNEWHPARSEPRDTQMLVQLANTLGNAGNDDLRAGLLGNLARYQPQAVVSTATGATTSLAELAADAARRVEERQRSVVLGSEPPEPVFDGSAQVRNVLQGDFVPLTTGSIVGAHGAPTTIGLFASRRQVVAVESGAGGAPLWRHDGLLDMRPTFRPQRAALVGDHVLLAEHDRVVCLAAATGEIEWTQDREDRAVDRFFVEDGVVVTVYRRERTRVVAEVLGYDVTSGIELWRLPPIDDYYHPALKVADGRFVMLPKQRDHDVVAVHDLFTGHPLAAIRGVGRTNYRVANAAWVDKGRLVIPQLEAGRSKEIDNAIVAYELDDATEAWRVDLNHHAGGTQNLLGIVEMPDSRGDGKLVRLAILAPVDQAANSGWPSRSFSLHLLNERLGALDQRPLAKIGDSAQLLGVPLRERARIPTPVLLVIEEGRAGALPSFRAIDPVFGELWKQRAVRRLRAKDAPRTSAPLRGDGVLAVLVHEEFGGAGGGASGAEVKLMFLDSASGAHVETRTLETQPLSPGGWREMMAFGDTLVVSGKRETKIFQGAKR